MLSLHPTMQSPHRGGPGRRLLFALFYVSGIAGLIYQVLWLRRLSLVFGVTVYAASTVLAAFMAGLAAGSAVSGRVLRKGISPLTAFGIAEILVGVTALLSPVLLDAAAVLYSALHRGGTESLTVLTVARLVSSFAILAVPTAMMGITLPLLSAAVAAPSGIGLLYAVNTLGAMTGTLLSGLILIPAIGIQNAFLLAASLNVAVGAVALWLAPPKGGGYNPVPDVAAAFRPPIALALVVAVSGFASLGLEIVWFRLMLQFVIATTEAFTAMLATVLAGIAIGGLIAARILRRPRDRVATLGIVQALTGVAAAGSMTFLLWTVEQGWKTMGLWQAVIIAILPPSLFMGIGFPLALGIAGARHVGLLYALNVAAAILGSLGAGFILLPRIGSVTALIVLAGLFVVSGVWLAIMHRRWIAAVAIVAAFAYLANDFPDPFKLAINRRYGDQLLEFWRHEGAQTAVSVRASAFQHVLYLDGLHQANDQPEMVRLHRALGHLPMVLHGNPREVLVVGMGGGATPGAVSQYPDARVQIVELSEGVRQAAQFFKHVNYDLLTRPNVSVRIDDGRNFLSLTDRKFDVITADIIQPGHAGAGHVYSREYFSLVRNALKDEGVVLQWIGHRPHVEYTLIMRTFLDVFPEATLWYDANFMVGTKRPLKLDRGVVDRLRARPETAAALREVGLTGWPELRSWYTGGPAEMRAFVGDGPMLTDDRPLVEYHHWLPRPEEQPPLDLSPLRGDVMRHVH
ncbi:MAG TPA: fused MFS/spermidine synthase [Vicinamibacterales bacterium]|nr:fused MFS/spermidine synthase [Vicinamibacterales bacterium]